jgi:hypothetical protein
MQCINLFFDNAHQPLRALIAQQEINNSTLQHTIFTCYVQSMDISNKKTIKYKNPTSLEGSNSCR